MKIRVPEGKKAGGPGSSDLLTFLPSWFCGRFLDDRFIVGLNYVYNSAYSREINPVISPVYEHTRNWVDLSAAYHASKRFKIKAAIQNLLGEHTPGSGGFLMGVPSKYALGDDEPRVYISGELTF
jgi:hypothetical protein